MSFWKLSVGDWIFEPKRSRFYSFPKGSTLEEIAQGLSKIGINGIEFLISNVKEWTKEKIDKVVELTDEAGLERVCVLPDTWSQWPYGALTNPKEEERKKVIQFVKDVFKVGDELGAKLANIWPGSDSMVSPFGEPYWTVWGRFVESISECVDEASKLGLKVAVEYKLRDPAEFQILNNSDAFIRLANEVKSPSLGACLDTGHALQCREHLPSTVEKLQKWLLHVHLDDNYGDWDEDLAPGRVHDFTEFFKALRRVGYKGYLMFDLYPITDPFKEVEKSKRYVDETCAKLK